MWTWSLNTKLLSSATCDTNMTGRKHSTLHCTLVWSVCPQTEGVVAQHFCQAPIHNFKSKCLCQPADGCYTLPEQLLWNPHFRMQNTSISVGCSQTICEPSTEMVWVPSTPCRVTIISQRGTDLVETINISQPWQKRQLLLLIMGKT